MRWQNCKDSIRVIVTQFVCDLRLFCTTCQKLHNSCSRIAKRSFSKRRMLVASVWRFQKKKRYQLILSSGGYTLVLTASILGAQLEGGIDHASPHLLNLGQHSYRLTYGAEGPPGCERGSEIIAYFPGVSLACCILCNCPASSRDRE